MKNKFFITIIFLILLVFQFNNKCLAASSFDYGYSNPLSHYSITSFLETFLTSIQGIVGWVAVIFIVIGGVMYLTAGGKDSQLTLAKNTIISALIGFSLAVAGPSLLKEIKDILGGTGTTLDIDNAKTIKETLDDILSFTLTLVGILALISFIYSGFSYLSSMGSSANTDKAKKIASYSIVALAISGGSLIILQTILNFFN